MSHPKKPHSRPKTVAPSADSKDGQSAKAANDAKKGGGKSGGGSSSKK
ncbi:hypothetical protein [Parvularcula dongshanensis]|uniref:Uncharacterized protein n=1 Tax=Parvularcula dongshanensis TaxID=1173995 RepID=A0A840I0H0_9PROT|nr:hypothetical protein [Parvularcula dongshanensis]MBB4658207.1 hypothetical protein [Parvularcula dongshanensis]